MHPFKSGFGIKNGNYLVNSDFNAWMLHRSYGSFTYAMIWLQFCVLFMIFFSRYISVHSVRIISVCIWMIFVELLKT